jgi:hypothetical protein
VRLGRAKPIAFDYDSRGLRIGSQLYLRDDNGLFQSLNVDRQKIQLQPYFEEFVMGPGYVVVTSQ